MYSTKILSLVSVIYIALFSTAFSAESVQIENAWSPEAPPVATVMAGYMTIKNISDKNLTIQSAKSKLFKRVEIHLMDMKDGMMHMVRQENVSIKANSELKLEPGALHMMLIGRIKPIKSGSVIPVTLTLDNGENIAIKLKVNNKAPQEHHHH